MVIVIIIVGMITITIIKMILIPAKVIIMAVITYTLLWFIKRSIGKFKINLFRYNTIKKIKF